jgi:hypothetical protein
MAGAFELIVAVVFILLGVWFISRVSKPHRGISLRTSLRKRCRRAT